MLTMRGRRGLLVLLVLVVLVVGCVNANATSTKPARQQEGATDISVGHQDSQFGVFVRVCVCGGGFAF